MASLIRATLLAALPPLLAPGEPHPAARAVELVSPVAVDGDLGDWEGWSALRIDSPEQLLDVPHLGKEWGGPADVSARLFLGHDRAHLYVAGEVLDDRHVENPIVWWDGDAIELFFRLPPADPVTLDPAADGFQIFLMPLSTARPWGVVWKRGGVGATGDGGFADLRVAAKETPGGYTFEAAIPLVHLPGLDPGGPGVPFNVAIDDADDPAKGTRTYMVWANPGPPPFNDARARGTLRLAASLHPPPVGASPGGGWPVDLVVSLGVLSAVGGLLFLSGRLHRRLGRRSFRFALLLLAALGLSLPAAEWLSRTVEGARRRDFEEGLRGAESVLSAVTAGELGFLEEPSGADRLLRALRGETVEPRGALEFSFPPIPAEATPEKAEFQGIPFRRDRIPLERGEPVGVDLHTPASVGVIHLALTPDRPRVSAAPGAPPTVVVRLDFEDGTRATFDLRLSQPQGRAEFPTTKVSTEIFRRSLEGGRRLVRLELEATSENAACVVEGVTLSSAGGHRPLPLGAPTASGIPTRIRGPRPGTALPLPAGRPAKAWPLGGIEAQVLFLVVGESVTASGTSPALAFQGYGEEIVEGTVECRGGGPVRFVLRHGIDVHASDLRRSRHPPDPERRAEVAFVWEKDGEQRHLDVVTIDLGERRRVERLLLRNLSIPSKGYDVEVAEVVLARRSAVPEPAGGSSFTQVPEGRRLSDDARKSLRDLDFAFVDLLGRSAGGGGSKARATREEVRDLFSKVAGIPATVNPRANTWRSLLPVRVGRRPVGALVVTRPTGRALARVRLVRTVPTLLGALLAPFFVVAAANLLAAGRRMRLKLAGAFLLTSIVPVLFVALGFADLFGRRERAAEESRLLGAARDGRERLRLAVDEIEGKAKRLAEGFRSDPRVQGVLDSPDRSGAEATLREVLGRLRESLLPEEPGGFVRVEVTGKGPGAEGTGARLALAAGAGADELSSGEVTVSDAYRLWGRHLRVGVIHERTETRAVRCFVGAPLLLPALAESGLKVFSLEGLLLSSEGSPAADRTPESAAAIRSLVERSVRSGEPEIDAWPGESGPRRLAVAVLRDREGQPVAAVGAVAPAPPPGWTLGGVRVRTRTVALALAAAVLAMSLAVAQVLTRRITSPIERLERGARALEGGDAFEVAVEIPDEIGGLARTFNTMAEELRRRLAHLSALNRAFRDLASHLDLEGIARESVRILRETGGASRVLVAVGGESGRPIVLLGEGPPREISSPSTGLREALGAGAPLEWSGTRDLPWRSGPSDPPAPGATLVVPLQVGDRKMGAAILGFERAIPAERDFFLAAASQVAIALENARLYRLALEDPRTGLLHEAAFRRRLADEVQRAGAIGRPVSLALFAVLPPAFRRREAIGGDPLGEASGLLRAIVRQRFALGRSRADEIGLVLPQIERERAARFAARVRDRLDRCLGEARSAAAGVASYPRDAGSADFLFHEAARLLGRARSSPEAVAVRRAVPPEGEEEAPASWVVARSEAMVDLLASVDRLAASELPVLIQGETGVGKEVLADEIHRRSHRAAGPLVKVNCAAIPGTLLEAELFGHERGAFTGAERRRPGRFEAAAGGTLFLDEIGDLAPDVQAKLLRVLQDRQVTRLGGNDPVPVDVRIVAATNRDLRAEVSRGSFRADLFYRLNAVSLLVPPLRERREEIPLLARLAIRRSHETEGTRIHGITAEALDRLYRHAWAGNVRELFNVVRRSCVEKKEGWIRPEDLPLGPAELTGGAPPEVGEVESGLNERQKSLLDLLRTRGWIRSRDYAERLGLSRRTAVRDLMDLMARGLVVRVGRRRGAAYRLATPRSDGGALSRRDEMGT